MSVHTVPARNAARPAVRRRGPRRVPPMRSLALVLGGAALLAGSALALSRGEAAATVSGALRAVGEAHWVVLPVLVALVVAHFWFSAVALSGAAGRRLPLLHATMAQFTAATANRVTGGGLGTVAVNARYLAGGGTSPSRAVALAGLLQVFGAISDLLLFAVVIPVALATGGGALLPELGRYLAGLAVPLIIVAAVAAVAACVAFLLLRDRLRDTLAACAQILRRPRDLLVMTAASAATTLVMGLAFAISMLAVPGAATPGEVGTLVAIYMLAAAAGGLVPGPGGLGSTEAALVGLLALTGTQTALALSGVLIFRAVTHWAPVPIGLLFAGTLRRRREERAAGTRALPGRVPVRVIAEEFFGPLAKRYAFLVKPETQRP
ncbi:hypothetical protein Acsp03_02120 [Actinomadura sp. NBRC 104412]|uniref:lysylphosphatidylglycerol synthase transmembrane domain-containing protein n=1 Tax=Actinomadura sp. NBRC 104412 TaxID=3032203 RepID=UPI0024A4EDC3|nr:lysylphosphatidylglycerol synthase domain-containing protein [Actinomadura sp. NBRC 104412]GLZ02745.1 hypothetical protein Acsp03_02120 [Actinomadura sp. NBRC 104412]